LKTIELSGFLALCDLKIGDDVVKCESLEYNNNIFKLVIPIPSNKERYIVESKLFKYLDHIQEAKNLTVAKAHLTIPYYALSKITT